MLPHPEPSDDCPGTTLGQAASQAGRQNESPRSDKSRRVAISAGIVTVVGIAASVLRAGGHKPQFSSRSQAGPGPELREAPVSLPMPLTPAPPRPNRMSPKSSADDSSVPAKPKAEQPESLHSWVEVPDRIAKAASATKSHHLATRPAVTLPVSKSPSARPCSATFYLDTQGQKHFKPECFLGQMRSGHQ